MRVVSAVVGGAVIGAGAGAVVFLLLPHAMSQVPQGLLEGGVLGCLAGLVVAAMRTSVHRGDRRGRGPGRVLAWVTAAVVAALFRLGSSNPQIDQVSRGVATVLLFAIVLVVTSRYLRPERQR